MGLGSVNGLGGGGSGNGSAADMAYDNSKSGLKGDTVQAALDELALAGHTIENIPTPSGTLPYKGAAQSPTWNNYDPNKLEISGDVSGTNVGTYTATFTPKTGYVWTDGTTTPVEVNWQIVKASLTVPAQTGSVTFKANTSQSPSWDSNYDSAKMTLGGTTSATAAGSHNATFDLKDKTNYQWADGTTTIKTVAWSIGKADPAVTAPTAISGLKYNGNPKALVNAGSFPDGTTMQYSLDGNSYSTSVPTASAVGSYTVYYRVVGGNNYNDVAAKTVAAKIDKGDGSLTIDKTSMTLDVSTQTGTITATATGTVSAESSNTDVATVSVSGSKITVTAKAKGSATITIKCAGNSNYNAPANKTCSVTVDMPTKTLNDNSWATISAVSKSGKGDLYWEIGDAKAVTLNGKVGDYLTLSNKTLYPFILDFNHVDGGVADNNIMWGCFKSAATGGVTIALYDSNYSPDKGWATYTGGQKCFTMNHWGNYNYGGWKGCDFRYDILGATSQQPSDYGKQHTTSCVGYDATAATLTSPKADTLLAAFPSDVRSAMRLRTHYADSKGNSSNVEANVTSVVDAISLLMEFEVFGSRSYANQYEQNKQTQFAYFKNGNSKKWYKYDNTGTEAQFCWLGSARYDNAYYFCFSNGGSPSSSGAYFSLAAPAAFKT